jgi:hypothetical protein
MMEDFDLEIKKMRLDYDISAISTQLIDEKRKLIELKKNQSIIFAKVKELEGKIDEKKLELANLDQQ